MARAHLYRPVQDSAGDLVTDVTVRLLEPGTETPIAETIYADRSSNDEVENPFTVASGIISVYLPYPRIVRVEVTISGATTYFEDVPVGFPQNETLSWSIAGDASPMIGMHRLYIEHDSVILSTRVSAGVAPTGAPLVCDINKNGTTLFTTQAERPSLAAGANTVLATPDVTTLEAGSYLTFDVDSIGSALPGSHVVVQVRIARA